MIGRARDKLKRTWNLNSSPYDPLIVHVNLKILQSVLKDPKHKDSSDFNVQLNNFVVYGIYKLKLSPTDFPSKEKFLERVLKETRKQITKDMEKKFLEFVLKSPVALGSRTTLAVLDSHFNLRVHEENLIEEDLKAMVQEKLKQYANQSSGYAWSKFGQNRSIFFGVAVASLIGASVGIHMLLKRRASK